MRNLASIGIGVLASGLARAANPDMDFPIVLIPIVVYAVSAMLVFAYIIETVERSRR